MGITRWTAISRSSFAIAALALPLAGAAQTTYHDPQGRYEVQVPEGWKAAPDDGVDQIIIRKGAVQVTLFVSQQHKSNAMTPQQYVEGTAKEFQDQCPTFKSRQQGKDSLVGEASVYEIFTCSDAKSPAVAQTSSVLTKDYVLVGFTAISPIARYYESLPALDGIRDSLRLAGQKQIAVAPKTTEAIDSLAMTELRKACLVGAFLQEECARKEGMLLGKGAAPSGDDSASSAKGTIYRDPQGRFSVRVPEGWKAISEGDGGVSGVQLRSGSNWINVMPAKGATSASEVVLHQEEEVASQSNSGRKPPFGRAGLIQIFGNGLEVSFDNFEGVSRQGDAIDSYVAGVGTIDGKGRNFLLLMGSIGKEADAEKQAKAGGLFLAAAQSIRLGSE